MKKLSKTIQPRLLPGAMLLLLVVSMTFGCRPSKDDDPDKIFDEDEIERFEEFEVDRDTVRDTIFNYGSLRLRGKEVARIVCSDSLDAYLSVRFHTLQSYPSINNRLYELLDSFYAMATLQSPDHKNIGSSTSVVNALEGLTLNYRDSILANAADSLSFYPGSGLAIDFRPVYATNRYVTYSLFFYNFVGGARPETEWYFATYPLGGGNCYRFEDIVKPESRERVRALLLQQMAQAMELSPADYLAYLSEWLGYGDEAEITRFTNSSSGLPDSSNVDPDSLIGPRPLLNVNTFPMGEAAITEEGLIICYPRYSIGPAYDALPQFTIPRDSLLNDLYLQL